MPDQRREPRSSSSRTIPTSCCWRRSPPGGCRRSIICARPARSAAAPASASSAGTTCRARRSCAACPIASCSGTTPRSGSDPVARHARRSHRRHRRAVLRPVVRPRAVARPRVVLPGGRAVARPSDPAVRVFGDDAESVRVEVRAAVDRGDSPQQRSAAARGGHPGAAASGAAGRVGRCLARALRERGAVRPQSGQSRCAGRLFRLAVSQPRRRRAGDERVSRGGHRRPSGVHAAAARVRDVPGGRAALPLPRRGRGRVAESEPIAAGSSRRARVGAGEAGRARRTEREVHPRVRPAAGLGRAGDAGVRRRDRGARRGDAAAAGAVPRPGTARCSRSCAPSRGRRRKAGCAHRCAIRRR